MDSTEFTNQLVNFAGVEQQINANQKLDALVSTGIGNAFSSSLNYVGLDVSYLSSEAYFDGSRPIKVNYAIDGQSVDTTINIFDSAGDLVFTQEVSDDEQLENFTWDGRTNGGNIAPEGTYEIQVGALDAQGQALETSTVVTGHVRGIETQNGITMLLIGERAVSLGNIINVSEPEAAPANITADDTTDTQDEQQQV
tara:strand:- start:190 stop:780 length:591 start_codon:yes stop_codon:yes gene_type:complete